MSTCILLDKYMYNTSNKQKVIRKQIEELFGVNFDDDFVRGDEQGRWIVTNFIDLCSSAIGSEPKLMFNDGVSRTCYYEVDEGDFCIDPVECCNVIDVLEYHGLAIIRHRNNNRYWICNNGTNESFSSYEQAKLALNNSCDGVSEYTVSNLIEELTGNGAYGLFVVNDLL